MGGASSDAHLASTLCLGYGSSFSWFCCVWTFLTEELTNETKALEDVLREKEGKLFFYSHRIISCFL